MRAQLVELHQQWETKNITISAWALGIGHWALGIGHWACLFMGDLFPFPLRISRIVDVTSATHRWHLMLSLYATLHITALQRLMSKTNKKSIRALSYTSQNTTASKLLMLIYLDVPMMLKIVQCIKKEGYHDVGECHGNQGGKRFPAGCLSAFGPHFELDLCWILP